MKFEEFGLQTELTDAISYMGFENATPIQEQAIPTIINGGDLIACAQTGTGKTAAFLLPVINNFNHDRPHNGTDTLIIVPTRELALQVDKQIEAIGYFSGIESTAVYGGGDGKDWEKQKKALLRGTDIIVATPGKLISHLNMGYVKFDKVKHLILDEADRMLDIGFYDDLIKIISYLPDQRQTLMFSATMAPKIRQLAKKILKNPKEINIAVSKPAEGVLQAAYLTFDEQKAPLIDSLLANKKNYKSIIIFCSTKKKVSELTRELKRKRYNVQAVSSDLDQSEREEAVNKFRNKNIQILVATDVLSRGIDIKDINLVINYDVPGDAEDYVHRIGRTARADTTGVAITLINKPDMYKFKQIEDLMGMEVNKVALPPELGKGPEWNPDAKRSFRGGGNKRRYNNSSKGRKRGGGYKGKKK